MSGIELSICIVSWNICEKLKNSILSIFKFSERLNIEIIVVDNASSDGTVDMIKKMSFPKVSFFENEKNIGFARACNIAIMESRGDYILLLNPDMLIIEQCFKKMISLLNSHPKIGVVGCKLVNINKTIQKSYFKKFPTLFTELKEGMLIDNIYNKFFDGKYNVNGKIEVAWLIGGCMMLKKDILKKLHGFDEQYFMYGEDVDLCFRIHRLGLKIFYLPEIKMLHYHGASSKKQTDRFFATLMQKESTYIFMRDNYGIITALLYRIVWIVSGLYRLIVLVIGGAFSIIISKVDKKFILWAINKSIRVILWGIGFEKWTRIK